MVADAVKNKKSFDGCDGCHKDNETGCFKKNKTLKLSASGFPDIEVDRENWFDIVNIVRRETGIEYADFVCLLQYSVCPLSVIDNESYVILDIYKTCNGYSNAVDKPSDLLSLPAVWVDTCDTIKEAIQSIQSGV